jgi:ribosomal protein L20
MWKRRRRKKILKNVECYYTPKHASRLNAAGIEINVMDIECTGRRTSDKRTLAQDVAART